MHRVFLFAGLALLIFGTLAVTGSIPLITTSTPGSTLCVQSVLQLTPQATICPGASFSSLSDMRFGNTYLSSPASPTLVTSSSGTLYVDYTLGSGLSLSSYSLVYCTNAIAGSTGYTCPSGTSSISVTNQGVNSNGFGTFSGQAPSFTVNTVYYFIARITDSSGASYSGMWALQYVQSSYPVTFTVIDSGTGAGIAGANVVIYSMGGSRYANLTTSSSGTVTAQLPYGQYQAVGYAKNYAPSQPAYFYAQSSPSVTLKLTKSAVAGAGPSTVFVKVLSSSTLQPLSGAMVQISYASNGTKYGNPQSTNSTGFAAFLLPTMTNFVANATYTGYRSTTATFLATSNLVVQVMLNPKSSASGSQSSSCVPSGTDAAVFVSVADAATGKPISNAVVSVGGLSARTDANGNACITGISVPTGNNPFNHSGQLSMTVSASGYATYSAQVTVTQGSTSNLAVDLQASSSSGGQPFAFGQNMLIGVLAYFAGGVFLAMGLRKGRR